MSCPTLNLTVCTGETFRRTLVYKDSNGVPINISAWTATFTVGATTYVSPSPQVVIDAAPGTVKIELSSSEVAALTSTLVPYQVILTNPLMPAGHGDVVLLEGKLEVE